MVCMNECTRHAARVLHVCRCLQASYIGTRCVCVTDAMWDIAPAANREVSEYVCVCVCTTRWKKKEKISEKMHVN